MQNYPNLIRAFAVCLEGLNSGPVSPKSWKLPPLPKSMVIFEVVVLMMVSILRCKYEQPGSLLRISDVSSLRPIDRSLGPRA